MKYPLFPTTCSNSVWHTSVQSRLTRKDLREKSRYFVWIVFQRQRAHYRLEAQFGTTHQCSILGLHFLVLNVNLILPLQIDDAPSVRCCCVPSALVRLCLSIRLGGDCGRGDGWTGRSCQGWDYQQDCQIEISSAEIHPSAHQETCSDSAAHAKAYA